MITQPHNIISDDEIQRVHRNASFGPSISSRAVVNEGVAKCAVGYHCGATQIRILREHKLITVDASLTKKGKKYARAIGLYSAWEQQQ